MSYMQKLVECVSFCSENYLCEMFLFIYILFLEGSEGGGGKKERREMGVCCSQRKKSL